MDQQREPNDHQEMRELLREVLKTQELILRRLELLEAGLTQKADS